MELLPQFVAQFIDLVLHLDKHLTMLVAQYGTWIYAILFLIIFCETGLVVTPFLPGDSLLFVAGALAATGGMDICLLVATLMVAAILGDGVNFRVGRWFGPKVFRWEDSRFFSKAAFEKTHSFYEHHGGKTIVIARFLPILRTYAPFVAGVAEMTATRFTFFNVIGAVVWVGSLCLAGYWFGNLPLVKGNLMAVIVGIIALSLMPMLVGWLRHRQAAQNQ
ncbi:MAG: DedA family protein [Gammaproteobacteria bacterium]|nr:DedA family protein [Gammaproteobacteria bacterium]MBU1646222.1 DedA family protein [Gammaproteobacteria bacterium]MBU1972284.1 DedA family protein [Gammaproteobacteria bacterium]